MNIKALQRYAGMSVLIVDDNESNVAVLKALVEQEGLHRVYTETDSRRVHDRLVECRPDLVLLDLHMPKSDGHQVLRQIKEFAAGSYLPVLVLTVRHRRVRQLHSRPETWRPRLPHQAVRSGRSNTAESPTCSKHGSCTQPSPSAGDAPPASTQVADDDRDSTRDRIEAAYTRSRDHAGVPAHSRRRRVCRSSASKASPVCRSDLGRTRSLVHRCIWCRPGC